ncbi:uncharacterized protein [Halyomorpha halys]|uniref:uncharacterized protein n=1 Tax=Halyomorpha halys TaxID=286706 RepID=UPI0006D50E53|nr:uncharacterized protein LOC106682221 [Halyomorpha halys]
MSNSEARLLKWTGHELMLFLSTFRKYEELWNINNDNFNKKCLRQISLRKLLVELTELGFDIPSEIHLRKKIKNIKDVYRNELNKVKKSMTGGSEFVYKPKLLWYNEADSFLNSVTSIRQSNIMDDIMMAKPAIKDEGVYNDIQNSEYIDEIPHPPTETYENIHQMNESGSSIKIKCEPLIEMSNSPQPPMKKIKKEPDTLETLNQCVNKLHEIVVMPSSDIVEDEYYYFAMHIASQLRKLPTRSFIVLQERIQCIVSEERLKTLVSPEQSA